MATTRKLPKVTEYVKNVGKSLAFASIDAVKERAPGIREFIDTNDDIFKEAFSAVRNYRASVKGAEKSIKQSNAYQAIEAGIKNMIDDAKTGKFYNTERASQIGESALGLDDFDMSGDTEVSFGNDDESSSSAQMLSDSFSDAIGAAATSQNTVVAQGTNMMIQSNKASTKLLMAHMDKTSAAMTSSIGSVYSAVSVTNAFLNGPMQAHLENSRRFYEENLRVTTEMNLMLKELLEMQRNLYKAEASGQGYSKLDESMRFDGSIDIKGYAKNIKSNISSIADSLGLSMLKMDMGGGNPYMMYAAAPFNMILSPMMDRMMSKDFKKALASFDKGITSMFSQLVSRMNTAKKNDDGSFLSILGKLFGISIDVKDDIDTSKFKKDAVPFDGITRQSIIETIPGYLSRIEAALTGGSERHYDYNSGTWKSAKQVQKEYSDMKSGAIIGANYEAMSSIERNLLSKVENSGNGSKKKAKDLRKQSMSMFEILFADGGDFRADGLGPDGVTPAWKYYKFKSKKDFEAVVSAMGRDAMRGLAANNMRERETLSKNIRNHENNGGVYRQLYNGAYDESGTGSGKRHNPSNFVGGGKGLLASSTDNKGHNIFWYLNNIIDTIRSARRTRQAKNGITASPKTKARFRFSRSKSSSTDTDSSDSSDGDPGGDDEPDLDAIYEEERRRREEAESKNTKSKGLGDWFSKKFGNSPLGKRLAKMLGGAEELLSKPMKYMTNLLNKADEGMFKMMFGNKEIKDDDGNTINGVFPLIIHEVKSAFKGIKEWFTKQFNSLSQWFKKTMQPLWEKYGKPVVDNVKNMAKAGWQRVKTGVSNTFGKGFNKVKDNLKKGGVSTAEEVENAAQEEKNNPTGVEVIPTSAHGRYVTKRGLTMISPGEMIIPASFDKKEQQKMLSLEKRDRSRIYNAIGLNAKGTVNTEELKKNLHKIYEDNTGKGAKNIAGGILGAGAGLLTGINPLLGAMAGAGLSILSNSETFKTAIFGKENEEGEREGGLIPKKITKFFQKALPDMGDFGIAGGLLGLITPLGPLGGAVVGAGIGMLKNSEGFKKFIFGDAETGKDGLISKESAEKAKAFLKKGAPAAAIGAVAGMLAGPFGLIGNAALGAGAGLIASTDSFHKVLFGDKEEGTNGLLGAINTGILEPAKEKISEFLTSFKEYAKKHILDPLKNFWKPFQQSIKNTITSVGDGVKDFLNDMFEKKVGLPIADFLQEKLFKPLTKTLFGILKVPVTVGKAIVAAPFKALGGIGNTMRMSQIRKGSAHDMSASERLAWREEHKGRGFFREVIGGKDKMLEQDQMLANMDEAQLRELATNSRAGLESMEKLQKNKAQARDAAGKQFSKFFNEKVDGKNRYSRVNYSKVKKVLEDILDRGDVDYAKAQILKIEGLTPAEKNTLIDQVSEQIAAVGTANDTYNQALKGGKETDKAISKILGRKINGRKDRRQIYRSAEAELKARKRSASSAKNAEQEMKEASSPEEKRLIEIREKSSALIDAVKEVNTSLRKLLDPNYKEEPNTTPNTNESSNNETSTSEAIKDVAVQPEKAVSPASLFDQATSKAKNFFANINPFKKEEDEDSKEAVDASKEEKEKEHDERTSNQAMRETAENTKALTDAMVGSKEERKKGKNAFGGLLGKIGTAIGGVFSFLGGPLSTVAKWGLRAVGIAGGVSLLGYASEWIKTSFWPKLKEILFGTKDADGNVTSTGLLSGIGTSFKTAIFGDGTAENPGLISKLENTAIGRFFTGLQSGVEKAGGIMPYIGTVILPAMAEKLVTGWGYAAENIVAPLVTLIVKHAPSLLASLAKAVIKGIGAAILNKEIKRDAGDDLDSTAAVNDINKTMSATNSALAGAAGAEVTRHFSNMNISGTKATVNWDSVVQTNYATADETYDAEGNHLNKDSNEILYEKAPGLPGLFGAKQLSNQLYYDENGNIALDAYYTNNTTDSIASKLYKAGARGFSQGLVGRSSPIGKLLGKTSTKGFGKGWVKGVTKTVGGVTKGAGKGLNAANQAGLKLNKLMMQSGDITSYVDDIVKTTGLSGKDAKALRNELLDDILTNGAEGVDNALSKVGSNSTKELDDAILEKGAKISNNFAENATEKAAKTASKNATKNRVNKFTDQVSDWFSGTKAGAAFNRKNVTNDLVDSVVEASGTKGRKAKKLQKQLTRSIKWNGSAGVDEALDVAAKAGVSGEAADDILEKAVKASDNLTKAPTLRSTVKSKVLDFGGQAADALKSTKAGKTVTNMVSTATDAVKNNKVVKAVTNVADDAKGLLSKITSKITSFFDEIATNSKIIGFFKKAVKKGVDESKIIKAIKKIGEKLSNSALGKASKKALTKIAGALAKYAPFINAALLIADFVSGYDNADTILGVAKGDEYKVGFGQKCLCGLLNIITSNITFGLVPNETVVDIIVEFLFPLFGLDATELQAARDRADQIMDEWNEAHPEETYTNLEDFNNKDKWWFKAGKALKKTVGGAWDKTKEFAGKAWDKTKEVAGAAWDKTKEVAGKAVDLVKTGFNAVADKTKEIAGGALDIGKFIKDCVSNAVKAAIDPEYSWKIEDYLSEDDPLYGIKNVVYKVMSIPMCAIGLIAKVGKTLFDAIKGFVLDVKDGFGDALQDISAVATGKYTVFSKEYWKFNDKDEGDNPLGIISKISSTLMKVFGMVPSMVGYVGSKVWQGLKSMVAGAKEGALDATKDIKGVVTGKYTIFSKEYWSSNKDGEGEENSMSLLGSIFGTIIRVISAPKAMLGWVGSKVWDGFKALIAGAKEGILDASSDVNSVKKGQYTIFNKNYWKSDKSTGDNELSLLGSIFGFVSRVFQAPGAMLGWLGTKVWQGFKAMINGAKEGILDASSDVNAVKKGQYTIFNKEYWDSEQDPENPLSKVGSIFGFVSRVFQAPGAMLGWIGTKVWGFIKDMIAGAKEGILDASSDVQAVKSGQYTIFNKDYWKSDRDEDNPLSKVGSIFGFVSRVFQAPGAMLGWVGTKVKEVFTAMIDGAKEGALDASTDVAAVKRGEYTIFDKRYWTSDADEDNPLSKVGSVFGFVMRLTQAPMAMLGYTFTKVKEVFTSMIDGVKDITSETDAVIDKAEKGDISIFSGEYWKVNVDESNPLGLLGKIIGFVQRLINAPIVLIKSIFGKITDAFGGITDIVGKVGDVVGGVVDGIGNVVGGIGDALGGVGDALGGAVEGIGDFFGGILGLGRGSNGGKGRKSSRRLGGRGHIYQSDAAISNMRYGDSTIAKAGCAPVAATNLINSINPNSMDVQQAAAYAENNDLTMRGGGTDIRYFNKFLGSQGIATMNTRNKDAVLAALKNGNQVVMLGQDKNNNPGAPFGTNPHFVTAKGIDKNGNIIVEDPDLPQSSIVYKQDKLLNSMTSSIITDGSKIKPKRHEKHGLGRRLWGAGDGEESEEVSVNALLSEFGNIGTGIIKQMFGSAYDALYGSNEDENNTSDPIQTTQNTAAANLTGNDNAEKIWNYLRSRGYTPAGAAGLMGNLYAESGLRPNNIQNSYEGKYGTDDVYTNAVNSKSHGKDAFSKDSAGYGLAQWTYHTRKKGLYEATVEQGKSVADLGAQLAYLDTELANNYPSVYKTLTTTTSTRTASDKVLTEFERPAKLNYDARRNYSQNMYSQFAGSGRAGTGSARDALNSYGYVEEAGTARAVDRAQVSRTIDYATFLETIVTILMNISSNTALLSKILELLSEKFNIDLDRAKVEAAANTMSREQTRAALNELVKRNGGSNSNVSKLLNNQDTDYVVAAMSAIASE